MTFKNFAAGLDILAKYLPEGLDTSLGGADHDIIHICPEDAPQGLTPEDEKALEALGFNVSEEGWYVYP